MAVQYISFLALRVKDLERSKRFYTEALGFRPISTLDVTSSTTPSAREFGVESLRTEMIFLERDGMRIQLGTFHLPERLHLPEPRRQLGYSHLGIRVDDLDVTLREVSRCGGSVVEGTRMSNPDFGSEVASIRDPDGARMELLQIPGDPTGPLGVPIQ